MEDKFEEMDIDLPENIDFEKLSYQFGIYCCEDFYKSVNEQFKQFFMFESDEIDWELISSKMEYY